mgnify:CR=1 FL=1
MKEFKEIKECKYRLPCNWCDRHNKYCDMVEPIEIELPKQKCNHEWKYGIQSKTGYHYVCTKCGTMKVVPLSNLGNI